MSSTNDLNPSSSAGGCLPILGRRSHRSLQIIADGPDLPAPRKDCGDGARLEARRTGTVGSNPTHRQHLQTRLKPTGRASGESMSSRRGPTQNRRGEPLRL